MNKRLLPYFIIGTIVVLLVFGISYLKYISPKFNWNESLVNTSKQPYGASIFYSLLKETVDQDKFHEIKYNDFDRAFKEYKNATYVFVGTNYFIDTTDIKKVVEYIKDGHKAFVAATFNADQFIEVALNMSESDDSDIFEFIDEDTVMVNDFTTNQQFTFGHQYLKEPSSYRWNYFSSYFLASLTNEYTLLSSINDTFPNFISITIGNGILYLNTTPILLSNYYLSQDKYFDYLQSIWKTIGSEEIIWDGSSASFYNKTSNNQLKESPLRFILKHRGLRWAWFMLIVSAIIFIISESKRKQRAIPTLPKKENNTLEYAKAIGSLYFQEKSHKAISIEMMNQLYSFIKARYNFKFENDKLKSVPQLAQVSGISAQKLDELFKMEIKLMYDKYADSEQLYKLYNLVEHFYKNCN